MAQLVTVRLCRTDNTPWGMRLQGGKDFGTPLLIQKVNMGSIAQQAGLIAGDSVIRVNNVEVFNMRHKDAQDVIVQAGQSFEVTVQRGGSTWRPSVTPTGPLSPAVHHQTSSINNIQTVTKTSLAKHAESSCNIGSGHNVSAKPFASSTGPQLNGGSNSADARAMASKLYNSPVGIYSDASIAETLSAQTEVLSTGALGVNFKKNEKSYNSANSEVLKMVQEADKEPRSPEPVNVELTMPVAAPAPPSPMLPPGQNICADCERLIVGVFVRIKDKNLHVECFKCATCGTPLKNVGYYNINKKLYCDIHAKMAARSNPPAPNLVPITVSPGSAISAALTSHTLPKSPLSPIGSSTAAPPFQTSAHLSGPKPFSISPSSMTTVAPVSPPSYSAPTFIPTQPKIEHHLNGTAADHLPNLTLLPPANVEDSSTMEPGIEAKIESKIEPETEPETKTECKADFEPKRAPNIEPKIELDIPAKELHLNGTAAHHLPSLPLLPPAELEVSSSIEPEIEVKTEPEIQAEVRTKIKAEIEPEIEAIEPKTVPKIEPEMYSIDHKNENSTMAEKMAETPPKPPTLQTNGRIKMQFVPLPEPTEPYFPPDRPVLPKRTTTPSLQLPSPFLEALTIAPESSLFSSTEAETKAIWKDLPEPMDQPMTMSAALTTLPDRPFTPQLLQVDVKTTEKKRHHHHHHHRHRRQSSQSPIKVLRPEESSEESKYKQSKESEESKFMQCQLVKKYKEEEMGLKQAIEEQQKRSAFAAYKKATVEEKMQSHLEIQQLKMQKTQKNVETWLREDVVELQKGFETQQQKTTNVGTKVPSAFVNYGSTIAVNKQENWEKMEKTEKSEKKMERQENWEKREKRGKSQQLQMPSAIPHYQLDLSQLPSQHPEWRQKPAALPQKMLATLPLPMDKMDKIENLTNVKPPKMLATLPSMEKMEKMENMEKQEKMKANIVKPLLLLPVYQQSLVPVQCLPPPSHHFQPATTSRSPSPRCPSPAAGPPPNPLVEQVRAPRDAQVVAEARQSIQTHLEVQQLAHVNEKHAINNANSNVNVNHINSTALQIAGLSLTLGADCQSIDIQVPLMQSNTSNSSNGSISPINSKNGGTDVDSAYETTDEMISPPMINYKTHPTKKMGGSEIDNKRRQFIMPKENEEENGMIQQNGKTDGKEIAVCSRCNATIRRGPFITALGKIWCPEHFVCTTASCRRPLQDMGFVEERGHLYCEFCFEQYLAPVCCKCSGKIKGECLNAIGKHFHPECFNCAYCGKLFGNSPFFLEDGQPYCDNDWNQLFTTKCFACGFPVEAGDRWVEALNNNYHSQCFNCTMCKKNLEGQSFYAKGGRPFCKNHAR